MTERSVVRHSSAILAIWSRGRINFVRVHFDAQEEGEGEARFIEKRKQWSRYGGLGTVTEAKVARAYLAETFLASLGPGHQAELRLQLDVLQLRRADGVR